MERAGDRYEHELAAATAAARAAGAAILSLYEQTTVSASAKDDGSLVTDADLTADRIIRATLANRFPTDPILSEEGTDDRARLAASRCWIVDPLDGTKQFVDRTGQFQVLIALVVEGRPVTGVIYQPTTDLLLTATEGRGAWIEQEETSRPLHFRPVPQDVSPRLATSTWLGAPGNLPILERVAARLGGGPVVVSSLGVTMRLLMPPDNAADALIGLNTAAGFIMAGEWDFAAPEVVVREAGGAFSDLWGRPHRYNKLHPHNVGGLLLAVDPATHWRIVEALRPELPPAPGSGCEDRGSERLR